MADTADKLISKFGPALDSLELNSLKQASFLESIYQLTVVSDIEQAKQINLLSRISNTLESALNLAKDEKQDRERAENLKDLPEDQQQGTPGAGDTKVSSEPMEFGLGSLLSAAALAPFAFSFIKGFLKEITDGLIELTPSSVLAALRLPDIVRMFGNLGRTFLNLESIATGPIGRAFDATLDVLGRGGNILRQILSPIKSVFTAAENLIAGPLGKTLSFFTGGASRILGLFGKLVWPFSIVMGAIDAVSEFRNAEGSLLERIGAGIGGFLGEIVGAPLDVLKSAVAWVLGKFGFDETASSVSGFSFEDTIGSIVGSMFGVVQDMVDWVKTLFTDPTAALQQLWQATLGGVASLIDLLYAPINGAINFVLDIFKWGDPNEPFRLQDEIIKAFNLAVTWIKDLFKWAPGAATDGWNGLTNFVSDKWTEVKTWFTDKLTWAGDTLASGWNGLSSLATTAFDNVSGWISSKFEWAETGLTEGKDFMVNLFNETIEKVKTWFTQVFDFLPSLDEVKATLTSFLPKWMQPEAVEEQRQNLQNEIQALQNQREEAPAREDINGLQDIYTTTKEEIDAEINDLVNRLNSLPEGRRGGIFNMPEEGGLAMLHGKEAVIPLDSTEGKSILGTKTEAIAQQTTAMATRPAPVMIQGGATTNSPVTNNNNNSRTTIVNNLVDPTKRLNHIPM